jgi:predicted ABC-type ATPase
MTSPVCTIIAGPNGAGKTTFALKYLTAYSPTRNFVNADLIAAGLSPLAPEKNQVEAARLFLREVQRFISDRESFAFETTLSGRSYLRMIRELMASGWTVHLFYLWLPSVGICKARVAERVARGGHNIPVETIERRYFRSVRNLLNEYAASCSLAICYDNSLSEPGIIFQQVGKDREVFDPQRYETLCQGIEQ